MQLIAFPDATFNDAEGCRLIEVDDDLTAEEIEKALEDDTCVPLHTFTGDDTPPGQRLTHAEQALVEEGLNYTETNGAPGLRMRPETKRMENMRESIEAKLRPRSSRAGAR
jgi:hypothetical protein